MTAASITAAPARLLTAVKSFDRVALVFLALISALFVFDAGQGAETLRFTADALIGIAPFLLISVALAAAIRACGADKTIARVFSGTPGRAIIAAAVFGALSPFCSCGVVPIVAALLAAGVPLAPVMAFCLASPVMDPEMFVLTAAEAGLEFTIAKTLAAAGLGLFGGGVTHVLCLRGWLPEVLKPGAQGGCGGAGSGPGAAASDCKPDVLREAPLVWAFWREPARRAMFASGARETAWFLGKWLTLAFALESLMVAHIPADWIAGTLGGDAWWVVPAAALAGVPAYLNGYAAIPLAASLMEMGMSPAAALTFMVAGGVTSVPAALAVFALVRARVFALYLGLALSGSMLAGAAYSLAG